MAISWREIESISRTTTSDGMVPAVHVSPSNKEEVSLITPSLPFSLFVFVFLLQHNFLAHLQMFVSQFIFSMAEDFEEIVTAIEYLWTTVMDAIAVQVNVTPFSSLSSVFALTI